MKVLFKWLHVHEFHSRPFDGLKLEGLGSGVTAVYAPNAAGKSVLAQAASQVLHPSSLRRRDRITGVIEVAGRDQEINLSGRTDAVSWPQSARENLYRFSVADFMAKACEEDEQMIRNALAGGIDLEQLDVASPGRRPNDISDAWTDLSERQKAARELEQKELELPKLKEELEQAQCAAEDAVLLRNWLLAAEKESRGDEASAGIRRISAQNPGIERQQDNAPEQIEALAVACLNACNARADALSDLKKYGDEPAKQELQATDKSALGELERRYDELSGQLQALKERQGTARQAADVARQPFAGPNHKHAPGPLAPADAQELETLAARIQADEHAVNMARQSCRDAEEAVRHAQRGFTDAGGDSAHLPPAQPSADDLRRAVALDDQIKAQEIEQNRAVQAVSDAETQLKLARQRLPDIRVPSAEALKALFQEPQVAGLMDQYREASVRSEAYRVIAQQFEDRLKKAQAQAGSLRDAEDALKEWLRQSSEASPPSKPAALMPFGLIAIAATAAIGVLASWFWAACIAVAGIGVLIFLAARASNATPRGRLLKDRVPEAWRPQAWTSDGVVKALNQVLIKAHEIAVLQEKASEIRGQDEQARDHASEAGKRLEERMRLIEQQTGMHRRNAADYTLASVILGLHDLAAAENGRALAQQNLEEVQKKLEDLKNSLGILIHEKMCAPDRLESAASATVWANSLGALLRAGNVLASKQAALDACETRLKATRSDLRAFFERFGWPWMDHIPTARDQFLGWFKATDEVIRAEQAAADADNRLKKTEDDIRAVEQALTGLFQRYEFTYARSGSPRLAVTPFINWFEVTGRVNRTRNAALIAERSLREALDRNGIPVRRDERELSLDERRDECYRRDRDVRPGLRDLQAIQRESGGEAGRLRGQTDWGALFSRRGLDNQPATDAVRIEMQKLDQMADRSKKIEQEIIETQTLVEAAEKANNLPAAQKTMDHALARMDQWLRRKQDQWAWGEVKALISDAVRNEATPQIVKSTNEHLSKLTGGRYGNITVDENIRIDDTFDGKRSKTIEQLSTGTRIHLGLALRLAVIEASETSDHAFPLLLDEVMATSDPDASRAIAKSVQQIAGERQVILFTNQPDDLSVLREVLGEDLPVRTLAAAALPEIREPAEAPPLPPPPVPGDRLPESEDDMDMFIRMLHGRGGRSGNTSLCNDLGWTTERYEAAKSALLAAGKIALGQGRGGSVRLTGT